MNDFAENMVKKVGIISKHVKENPCINSFSDAAVIFQKYVGECLEEIYRLEKLGK